MNKVKAKTLAEVCDFIGGSQPAKKYFSSLKHEGFIRLIQIRDYKTDKFTTYIPENSTRKFCNTEEIMIGRYGPPIFQILRGIEGAYNVALMKAKPKDNIINEYLYYFLCQEHLFDYINALSPRTGGQTGVDVVMLKKFPIQLPEIDIQKQIAKVLSDLDAKIEVNNKINQELEAMAKTLYEYWFVQFDFPDANGEPYKSSGGKMVYNKALQREVPEGWEVKEIKELANIIDPHPSHRAPKEVKEGFPFAGIGDIDKYGNINILKARVINEDFVNKQERDYEIDDTSLGYGRVGTVGKVVRLRKQNFRYALSPTMAVINPKNKKENSFIYFLINDRTFYKNVLKRTSGTTRPAIGIMELRKVPVLVPCGVQKILRNEFEVKISKVLRQIEVLNSQNQKLSELRDWLLPMLMNGQVTVGEVEAALGMIAEESAKYGKE